MSLILFSYSDKPVDNLTARWLSRHPDKRSSGGHPSCLLGRHGGSRHPGDDCGDSPGNPGGHHHTLCCRKPVDDFYDFVVVVLLHGFGYFCLRTRSFHVFEASARILGRGHNHLSVVSSRTSGQHESQSCIRGCSVFVSGVALGRLDCCKAPDCSPGKNIRPRHSSS